jgi:2-hydroxychromene-2-carboxylate isomerase
MKIGHPSPDPVVQDFATFEVAADQPYIYRLTGLGVEAARRGKGIELAYHVSHLIWGGEPGWNEGDKLAEAVAKAGLNLAELDAAITAEDPLPQIEANQAALDAAGGWGVPTMVLNGEPFFGQDRIDTLRWRLEKAGVPKR